MPQVEFNRLLKQYGAVTVMEDLSLSVGDGDFLVLLGPSGCGKTTLLNMLAGLEDVTAGNIVVDGRDITDLDPKDRGLAMVFQSYALYPTLTVRGNLEFGLSAQKLPRDEIAQRVDWAANLLQITPLMNRKPAQLSGGQRQRVAIGRALVKKVGLFLFDEPLSNLDAQLRTEMRIEIKRLHDEIGSTMVYVTHDQIEAMTMATKIAVMNGGVIQQFGTPDEVYERPANLFVARFIGAPAMNFTDATLESGPVARLKDGQTLDLRGYAFTGTPPTGPVRLGLRPEHFVIDHGGTSALRLEVASTERTGSDATIFCKAPDGAGTQALWAIRTDPEHARSVAVGAPLALSYPGDKAHLFDLSSTLRM